MRRAPPAEFQCLVFAEIAMRAQDLADCFSIATADRRFSQVKLQESLKGLVQRVSRSVSGPELAILRMLGLFDRPADEQTFGVLLESPAIAGLTESLTDLRSAEWQTILAKLRRARLSPKRKS
jgi:hypothetical protein